MVESPLGLTPAEKRNLRIQRREQHQIADAQEPVTAAASGPAASHSRTPASAPARLKGLDMSSLRSRLAQQSGPSCTGAADSSDAAEAAAMAVSGAAVIEQKMQGSPSAVAAENLTTGRKRKRSQLQRKQSAEPAAQSVRLSSTATSDQPELDAMTEQSRSSEAAMPVEFRQCRGETQRQAAQRTPRRVLQQEEQEEQECESEQHQPVRRTGRQRKLTAAAVAAVEDFPSLYKQPAKPSASASKATAARGNHVSTAVHDDWPEEAAPHAVRAVQRNHSKQAKACSTTAQGGGVSAVQMSQLIQYGVLPAGRHEFLFKNSRTCEVEVLPDGACVCLSVCLCVSQADCSLLAP